MKFKIVVALLIAAVAALALTVAFLHGRFSRAKVIVKRDTFLTSGKSKLVAQDFRGAADDFARVIEIDPNNYTAYHLRGIALQGCEEHALALVVLDQALQHLPVAGPPDLATLYNNRGYSKLKLGDLAGARDEFSRAVDLGQGSPEFLISRATVYEKLEDWEQACRDYLQALQAKTLASDTRRMVAVRLAAARQRSRLGAKLSEKVRALTASGDAKFNAREFRGALEDYEAGIALDPDDWTLYSGRGNAHNELGDWLSAIDDFNKALALNPEGATLFNNRGVAKAKSGDFEGGFQDLSKSLELDPQYTESFYSRAQVRQMMKDWRGSASDWDEVLRLLPTSDPRRPAVQKARDEALRMAEKKPTY